MLSVSILRVASLSGSYESISNVFKRIGGFRARNLECLGLIVGLIEADNLQRLLDQSDKEWIKVSNGCQRLDADERGVEFLATTVGIGKVIAYLWLEER
jgi:hypothetical protein